MTSKERPEWVHCVLKTPTEVYCGRKFGKEWCYANPEQARKSLYSSDRKVPCRHCLMKIGSCASNQVQHKMSIDSTELKKR